MDLAAVDTRWSDQQLLRGLMRRDTSSLECLSKQHARFMYSLALRILQDPGWAEEVVQDCLLRLWNAPQRYDPARGELRSWLLSVTHHAAIDGLRSRRGTARSREQGDDSLLWMADREADPADDALQRLRAEGVRSALLELPESQRRTIELAYYGGLSQTEISERTGVPLGTVKTRIRRGLDKLREVLERNDWE